MKLHLAVWALIAVGLLGCSSKKIESIESRLTALEQVSKPVDIVVIRKKQFQEFLSNVGFKPDIFSSRNSEISIVFYRDKNGETNYMSVSQFHEKIEAISYIEGLE